MAHGAPTIGARCGRRSAVLAGAVEANVRGSGANQGRSEAEAGAAGQPVGHGDEAVAPGEVMPEQVAEGEAHASVEALPRLPGERRGERTGERTGVDDRGRLRAGKLAGLSMPAAIAVLGWPVLLESFLNWLVGMTDTVLAAGLPENAEAATDAIGLAAYVMWFLGLCFMSVGVGATALIARSIGKGRLGVGSGMLGQATAVGVVAGTLGGVVVALLSPMFAGMNLSGEAARQGFVAYMLIICAATPVSSLMFVLIACSRGAGDSKRPLIAMIVRNAVNLAVSWLLSGSAINLGGFGEWLGIPGGLAVTPLEGTVFELGIVGIALGTALGDVAGAATILVMARSGVWGIRLKGRWLKPRRATMARLWRLGLPNFLETLGMWLGNFVVVVFVGALGAGVMGAHIIGIRIEALSFLPGFAMGMVAATLAGQYLGAGRPDLARLAAVRCMLTTCLLMGTLGYCFVHFPGPITQNISGQPTHLSIVPDILFISGLVQIPFGVAMVFRQAMRGAGDVHVGTWITWISTWGIRLPMAFMFSGVDVALGPSDSPWFTVENPAPAWLADWGVVGIRGLWIALCGELTIRSMLFTARFVHGGWLRKKV